MKKILPLCDKCGKPVPPENDMIIIAKLAEDPRAPLAARTRHFLSIDGCPGSPSRAQYIEGQPGDPLRPYDPTQEEKWREAYRKAQLPAREE